jgi:hypothetical protein
MGQENLTILLPKLVADTHEALLTWVDKDQGVIEPFDLLRRLVFQLMLHVICIPEIADDKTFRSRNLGEQPWKGHRGKTDGLSHGSWLVTGVYEQMIRIMKQRIRRSRRRKKMEVKPPKMRREQKDVLHVLMKRPLDKFAIGSVSLPYLPSFVYIFRIEPPFLPLAIVVDYHYNPRRHTGRVWESSCVGSLLHRLGQRVVLAHPERSRRGSCPIPNPRRGASR